jgi:hypothetical protein
MESPRRRSNHTDRLTNGRLPEHRCVCLIHQSDQAWGALESIDRNLEHLPPFSPERQTGKKTGHGSMLSGIGPRRVYGLMYGPLFKTYQSPTDSRDEANTRRQRPSGANFTHRARDYYRLPCRRILSAKLRIAPPLSYAACLRYTIRESIAFAILSASLPTPITVAEVIAYK